MAIFSLAFSAFTFSSFGTAGARASVPSSLLRLQAAAHEGTHERHVWSRTDIAFFTWSSMCGVLERFLRVPPAVLRDSSHAMTGSADTPPLARYGGAEGASDNGAMENGKFEAAATFLTFSLLSFYLATHTLSRSMPQSISSLLHKHTCTLSILPLPHTHAHAASGRTRTHARIHHLHCEISRGPRPITKRTQSGG